MGLVELAKEHPKGYCPVFGNYPKEYNRAVHGPYYPFVNYGPRTVPLHQVKLGELPAWFKKADKTPSAAISTVSRYFHLYCYKWMEPKHASISKGTFQVLFLMSTLSLYGAYELVKMHRNHKYHW